MLSNRVRGSLSLGLACLLATPLALPARAQKAELSPYMAGGNIAIVANLANLREAAIVKKMKEVSEQNKQMEMGQVAEFNKIAQQLGELTGLEQADFLTLRAAAKLDTVDLDAGTPPDLTAIDAVMSLHLAKPVAADKLEASLKTFAAKLAEEQGQDKPMQVARTEHRGHPVFVGTDPEDAQKRMLFAMAGGDQVLLLGSEMGVKGALDRLADNQMVKLGEIFPATVGAEVASADFYLLFTPTPAMTAKLKKQAAAAAGQGQQAAMAAMAANAFAGMKGLGLGIKADKDMQLTWVADLGGEAAAQQVRTMIDNQVISGIKMMGAMMTGGRPLPLLQTLLAEAKPNGVVSFKFAIADQDVNTFAEAAKERVSQGFGGNAPPAGVAMPPAQFED